MSVDNAKNFAKVTVSTGYDASATSIVLSSGDGAKLPTVPFNVVWWNSTDYADPSDDPNVEIVRVTARTTDTLTVSRAQEGTSASTKNTSGKTYKMIAGLTAKVINTDLQLPVMRACTDFSASGRFGNQSYSGSGSVVFDQFGANIKTGSTDYSSADFNWNILGQNTPAIFAGSPTFSCSVYLLSAAPGSGNGEFFCGLSTPNNAGGGMTWTDQHIGFKFIRTGGSISVYGTQADNTAESATDVLTTLQNNDSIELIMKVNGAASVDYYYRKNGGALVGPVNLTGNMPTATGERQVRFATNNKGTAYTFNFNITNASYER